MGDYMCQSWPPDVCADATTSRLQGSRVSVACGQAPSRVGLAGTFQIVVLAGRMVGGRHDLDTSC